MIEVFSSLWETFTLIDGELIGLAFTLLAALILYLFRAKVKLIYGRATNARNVISVADKDDQSKLNATEIYTEKFFLQNLGRAVANNVEFVLSSFPADVSVWQPRDVQVKGVEKGNCLVSIPQIAPKELVVIDCVYLNRRAAFVASVKCAEALGKEVPFWTVRRFPNWFNWTLVVLIFLGIAQIVQVVLKLLGGI